MDNGSPIYDLLHAHGLRKTPIRIEMLDLFMKHDFALSAGDVLAKMKTANDRATVYRALASFEEHGILHKASEDRQGIKYALGQRQRSNGSAPARHAHFVCEKCHQTYCLEDVVVPEIMIPRDFAAKSITFTINGICKHCKSDL